MSGEISISVVIPTCNRKASLFRLLKSLEKSVFPIAEVIIVDSGDDILSDSEVTAFDTLNIIQIRSQRSVCIQRNIGIREAKSNWIFLCDDDLEIPPQYLSLLTNHIEVHKKTGAVSGLVMQMEDKEWKEQYPITSPSKLIWNFVFQLSMWGEIKCNRKNVLINKIIEYYKRKGNHISKAGWPVLINFEGDYFRTPVYGLGASLVKKEWLLRSPYDEVLDANGIGDNYGVSIGFPTEGVHVLKNAFVFHHRESVNRPANSVRYLKRILALHYFIKTRAELKHVNSIWFLWSLIGTTLGNWIGGEYELARVAFKSTLAVLSNRNPYHLGSKENKKVVEPAL
jgi:glycosyltransferase involved in cell wall biosynthesis